MGQIPLWYTLGIPQYTPQHDWGEALILIVWNWPLSSYWCCFSAPIFHGPYRCGWLWRGASVVLVKCPWDCYTEHTNVTETIQEALRKQSHFYQVPSWTMGPCKISPGGIWPTEKTLQTLAWTLLNHFPRWSWLDSAEGVFPWQWSYTDSPVQSH